MSAVQALPLAETVVPAYETLRAQFVHSPACLAGELGLSVLLRHGMLAWWRLYTPVLTKAPSGPSNADPMRVSMDCHDELIHLMVAVTMTSSVFTSTQRGAAAI